MPVVALRRATQSCRSLKRAIVTGALGIALLSMAASASAQLSATLSVVSDYRYRGVSLSDNEPAAQIGVTYDAPQGWYAGAFVSTAKSETYETRGIQAIGFGGYAWRTSSELSLEVGADYVAVTTAPRYDYPEVYAGLTFKNVSARVYYAPRYFGQDSAAVYGELNVAQPWLPNARILAHIGVLGGAANNPSGAPVDALIGVGIDWEGFNLQVSWVGISHGSEAYAASGVGPRNNVVVSLSRSF